MCALVEQIAVHHRGRRGRRAPPYLEIDQVIAGKFRVRRMLGGGGFGQIFEVTDEVSKKDMAIKIGPTDHEPGRIILEQKVLSALSGKDHIPLFVSILVVAVACGVYDDYNYIIMQILGRNLSDLRKQQPKRHFCVATVSHIGEQGVTALKTVHDFGYIHRDVKPSNFCIGCGSKKRMIYLVDFGMARQFRSSDGKVRKERKYAGFRGTIRYVSVAVHERREPGTVDDLWSLFYSLIELMEGMLPWTDVTDADEVAEIKSNIKLSPRSMEDFSNHLKTLQYDHTPNYSLLINVVKSCKPPEISDDAPFEWEISPSKVEKSSNHE